MSSSSPRTPSEAIKRTLLRRAFVHASLPKETQTLVDFHRFGQLAKERGAEYRGASPFPHIVIDDFLPEKSLRAVLDAVPRLDDPNIPWGNLNANLPDGKPAQANKYHMQNVICMSPVIRQLISELYTGLFTLQLSQLTGIDDLIVDAQMLGGGIHLVEPGGLLRVHADFRRHLTYNLQRRLNLLLYLNEDWQEEYGGHLELWDREMTSCERRVLPVANRCVIFNTAKDSFHGHPRPLTCPPGRLRQSLALYYYTADEPDHVDETKHSTNWQYLPEERDESG